MKIGFSLGMCVADMVKGNVKLEDVIFIISGTAIKERANIESLRDGYGSRPGYWVGLDIDKCLELTYQIWDSHRLLQPRLHDVYRYGVPADCIWADMMPSPVKTNAALQDAWNNYRLLVDLTGDVPANVHERWQQKIW